LSAKKEQLQNSITATFDITITGVATPSTTSTNAATSPISTFRQVDSANKNFQYAFDGVGGGGGSLTKYTNTVNLTATATLTKLSKNGSPLADTTQLSKDYTFSISVAVKIGTT
jgi:hypothetical protein